MSRSRNWARVNRAVELRAAGATLEEIGQDLGVTRERARQILSGALGEEAQTAATALARALRRSERARQESEVSLAELLRRCAETRACAVCGAWVLRQHRGRVATTCSPPCAQAWQKGRFAISDEQREKQRGYRARSILAHPQHHPTSEVEWAKKILSGDPPAPNRRYTIAGSKASEVAAWAREQRAG